METFKLIAKGGKEWKSGEHHRIYFNNLGELLNFHYSNTLNIFNGKKISKSKAKSIQTQIDFGKLWFDVKKGEFRHSDLSDNVAEIIINKIKN